MKAVKAADFYFMQRKEQRVGTQYFFKAFSFHLVYKTQQRKLFFLAIVEVRADKAGVWGYLKISLERQCVKK